MEQQKKLTCRKAFLDAAQAGLEMLCFSDTSVERVSKNKLIIQEDKSVGYDQSNHRSPFIEGYCPKQSVKAGESIDMVIFASPAHLFKLEIIRPGYYGGCRARLMKTYDSLEGYEQPTPEHGEKNIHEYRWKPSLTLSLLHQRSFGRRD